MLVLLLVVVSVAFLRKTPSKVADVPHERGRLKKAFDAFDTDQSGELSKDEFRVVMTTMNTATGDALTDAEFEKLFLKVDLNEDGKISFDEYYSWSQRL